MIDTITRRLHVVPMILSAIIVGGMFFYYNNSYTDSQPWFYIVITVAFVGMFMSQYMVPMICVVHKQPKRIYTRLAYWVVFAISCAIAISVLVAAQRFPMTLFE